jgi:hypothetical protein
VILAKPLEADFSLPTFSTWPPHSGAASEKAEPAGLA